MKKTIITLISVLWCCTNTQAQPATVYTESLDFPPLPMAVSKTLEAVVRGVPEGAIFDIKENCEAPFRMKGRPEPIVVGAEPLRIPVEFFSLDAGAFKDEIILVRRGAVRDEIRIRLSGVAFRLERTDRLEFPDVMTMDTARRLVLVRPDLNADIRWEVSGRLETPFSLINRNGPILIPPDTLAFVFNFSPTLPKNYTDTIRLIRTYRPTDKPLDTITVIFIGTGRTMTNRSSVAFSGITVGQTQSKTADVTLPVPVRAAEFRYDARVLETTSPIVATVETPSGASKAQTVRTKINCAPKVYADGEYTVLISRYAATSQRPIDSVTVPVSVDMVPRPVRFRMGVVQDTVYTTIGSSISLDIELTTEDPFDEPTKLTSAQCSMAYNPTVFVPERATGMALTVNDDVPTLVWSTEFAPNMLVESARVVIGTIRGTAALGDADRSALQFGNASVVAEGSDQVAVSPLSSTLVLTNVWRYQNGTARLVNPLVGPLTAGIAPNPVASVSTLSVGGLPAGRGRLVVVDPLGLVQADLSGDVRTGKREFTISSSGAADIVVSKGMYYVRLFVEADAGNVINSIVRVIVVQ